MNDMELLREYASRGSGTAFATLVNRHLGLVWSVAWRHTADRHCAEEITQAVFVILAGKAATLRPATILSSWLFHTSRLASTNFIRENPRRGRHEPEAPADSNLPAAGPEIWRRLGPLLDEAIARLTESERNAVVLRFIEGKELEEIGPALGVRKDGGKLRTNRAVAKLRRFFKNHGVAFSATLMTGALSTNAVPPPPSGLAPAVVAGAVAKTASMAMANGLVKATLRSMPWTSQISRVGGNFWTASPERGANTLDATRTQLTVR